MREIRLVRSKSSTEKLVFELVPEAGDLAALLSDQPELSSESSANQFCVTMTQELRDFLIPPVIPSRKHASSDMKITTREIQERIRRGQSPEEVAQAAGVPLERIASFALPVIQERARVVELAKIAITNPERSSDEAEVRLDTALQDYCEAEEIDFESINWDAFCDQRRRWLVSATWVRRTGSVSDLSEATQTPEAPTGDSSIAGTSTADGTRYTAQWYFSLRRTGSDYLDPANELAKSITNPEPEPAPVQEIAPEPAAPAEQADEPADHVEDFDLNGPVEDPNQKKKRRRKAAAPSWDEVVLGLRSQTKRPRNGE
ncbi:MAG: septation protein SepH [Corynebacterium sp.]|nr:septation protein SepH [Corynebacterium sp.]